MLGFTVLIKYASQMLHMREKRERENVSKRYWIAWVEVEVGGQGVKAWKEGLLPGLSLSPALSIW